MVNIYLFIFIFLQIINKSCKDKKSEKKFEDIFPVIEKSLAPLDYAYKTARHLAFISPYSKNYLGFAKVLFTIFWLYFIKNILLRIFSRFNQKWPLIKMKDGVIKTFTFY